MTKKLHSVQCTHKMYLDRNPNYQVSAFSFQNHSQGNISPSLLAAQVQMPQRQRCRWGDNRIWGKAKKNWLHLLVFSPQRVFIWVLKRGPAGWWDEETLGSGERQKNFRYFPYRAPQPPNALALSPFVNNIGGFNAFQMTFMNEWIGVDLNFV